MLDIYYSLSVTVNYVAFLYSFTSNMQAAAVVQLENRIADSVKTSLAAYSCVVVT